MPRSHETDDYLPLTPLFFHVLLALGEKTRHGYGIIKEIEERSDGKFRPGTGTLYLALQRLESKGLIADAGTRRGDPRRRYYRLTPLGARVARAEAKRLGELVAIAEGYAWFGK